jgi:hypothetical protein
MPHAKIAEALPNSSVIASAKISPAIIGCSTRPVATISTFSSPMTITRWRGELLILIGRAAFKYYKSAFEFFRIEPEFNITELTIAKKTFSLM